MDIYFKGQELDDQVLGMVNGGAGISETKATIVNCDIADMMDQPGGENVIINIGCGTVVFFLGWEGDWGHVTYRSRSGYVYKDFLCVP